MDPHQEHPSWIAGDGPERDCACHHSADDTGDFQTGTSHRTRLLVDSNFRFRSGLLLVIAAFVSTQSTSQAVFQRHYRCKEYCGRSCSHDRFGDCLPHVDLDSDS